VRKGDEGETQRIDADGARWQPRLLRSERDEAGKCDARKCDARERDA
jgi:hypothetical protein